MGTPNRPSRLLRFLFLFTGQLELRDARGRFVAQAFKLGLQGDAAQAGFQVIDVRRGESVEVAHVE